MLIYNVEVIPDLTLSKYQAFADSGIDGMLEAQVQFIKQLHQIILLGKMQAHFIYDYDPKRKKGSKLHVYLVFSGNEQDERYYIKLRKIVSASNISNYFQLCEITEYPEENYEYSTVTVLRKKERVLQTVIDEEEKYFYLVPNWEMNENARLYNMSQLMEAFDEKCCYRIDLYVQEDLEERIHKNFETPLSVLRNISNTKRGLSEASQMQKSQRDPNADEVLHQYEDWLKAIDGSSVFCCRICAFSNDNQYCQLLLSSVASESIQKGNVTIEEKYGEYRVFDLINEKPSNYCLNCAPKSMQNWATTFTAEEISAFCRLPVLYDGETIEIPKETAAAQDENGIILGKDKNSYPVTIPPDMLTKHMFVCGVPGSGKTNTMLHLANSLWNHEVERERTKQKLHIPFLVLEPAKREYRELALFDIPELLIFSPSACTNFPMEINPFEFPKGLTLSEHIGRLCQVFEGAFPIAPPAPFILDRAIQAVYEHRGWNVKDINTGEKEYPLMSELYDQFEKELEKTNYDGEVRGNIRSVLEMRIGSLLRREMKEIFDVPRSTLSPEEWLENPVIIELESLGEGPANFVTLLLCTLIRETLKANPLADKEKKVRHVIFIEEAHNLIAPESQVKDGMDSNPKIAATAFIVKMLAEVRALREGIIIADQLPTAMAPEVIKNTNIKLVHRLTSQDDRELVGSTMSASPLQLENMATYISGQALYTYEKLLRPFEMRVSMVEEHGSKTPNDDELLRIMSGKSGFRKLQQRLEDNKYNVLAEDIFKISLQEKKKAERLFNENGINFKKIGQARFNQFIESCKADLHFLKKQRELFLFRIDELELQYISQDEIEELRSIALEISCSFERSMEDFKKLYALKCGR